MGAPAATPRSLAWAIAVLVLSAIVALWACDWSLPFPETRRIPATTVVPEQGQAFIAPIATIDAATHRASLRECRAERVEPLGFLLPALSESRVVYYLNGVLKLRFPSLAQRASCSPAGPADQAHDDIRKLGHGRYSVWRQTLYFSTTDGTDPRTNARFYELQVRPVVPHALRLPLAILAVALASWMLFAIASRIGPIREHRPGIVIAALMLVVLYAAAEAWLRYRIPFTSSQGQGRHDAVAGNLFMPGAEVHATNHAEYWVRAKANSLGFLDREPAIPKPPGTFRVLLLGDSFVEAVQVPLEKKVQVVLEGGLRKAYPSRAIDVVAMGYSGIGQSGEISFYEAYGKRLQPDLVIVLAVNNDFANNSAVLEAIRYGWHPRRPPVMFFDADLQSGSVGRVEIDPQWQEHMVHAPGADLVTDFAVRTTLLRRDPHLARLLAGWQPPQRGESFLNVEALFCTSSQLPVVRHADANTRHAFRHLAELGRRDGFKVLVVAAENVTTICQEMSHPADGLLRRLRAATDAADLELLDLYPAFAASGESWRFRLDRHWNEVGHARAAAAIARHLQAGMR
jgi:hypothetical protein